MAQIKDKHGNVIEEGDIVECFLKKRPTVKVVAYIKFHNNFGTLVACSSEESIFHFQTLKGLSDEYILNVVDEHTSLYL